MVKEIVVDKEFIKKMNELRSKPEGKSLFEACSGSIVLFAEYMLGMKLYSWQVLFLNRIQKAIEGGYYTKEFLAVTSRQIGKSTAVAILAIWCATFNKYPGTVHNNTTIGVVSASDTQAKKLLYEIKKLMRSGDKYCYDKYELGGKDGSGRLIGFFSELLDDNEPNNTTTITFKSWDGDNEFLLVGSKSGSVIKSYPPTSVVLGETFSVVIIDEAGKTERISDEFFEDYVYPTGNSTDAIRIYTSTPWVTSGFFYRMVDPDSLYGDRGVDRCLFTIDAIMLENPDYYKVVQRQIEQLVLDGKTDVVARAYHCRFIKGEANYFDPKKVHAVFDEDYSSLAAYKGECDMGIDFGGETGSHTVITISRLDDEGRIVRLFDKRYPVGNDMGLIGDVSTLLELFNVQRIVPDDCPAGWHRIKEMKEKGWPIFPMTFASDKVKKYSGFRSMMNKGLVVSYKDDDLQKEMNAMEYKQGQRSVIIKPAPGYTDDLLDSFLMSAYFFISEDGGFNFYDWNDVDDVRLEW